MSHSNWEGAEAATRRTIAVCDEEVLSLAASVGVDIPEDLPRMVAVARVRTAVEGRLGSPLRPSSERQMELLTYLSEDVSVEIPAIDSAAEASAWISFLYLKRRIEHLRKLRLKKGDIVSHGLIMDRLEEVSSIGDDGAVYFTGGRGARAWPDRLKVVARSENTSEEGERARRIAKNRAAQRATTPTVSREKLEALEPYEVTEAVSDEDIDCLRQVLDEADSEKPVQELLEVRPQLLATLLRGQSRYCRPKVRLGDQYITDFLLADIDSNGIRWILVELETPSSSVTLKRSNQFDRSARQGIAQVNDWRRWIENNLYQARQSRHENGIGLPDIGSRAKGVVLIGRREKLHTNAKAMRRELYERDHIQMQTYDRLVEQLEGARRFVGPWSASPYVL